MTRIGQLRNSLYGVFMSNVSARVGAILCIFLATLLLAHDGGAAAIGIYSLLHVLPGLVGTIASSGLPVSAPYFLAGPHRDDRRLPLTMITMALVAGTLGTALWVALAPLFGPLIFPDLSVGLVMVAGLCVLTRLVTITAKSCSQGSDDLRGANRIIFAEEFLFLPAYGLVWGLLGVPWIRGGHRVHADGRRSGRLIRMGEIDPQRLLPRRGASLVRAWPTRSRLWAPRSSRGRHDPVEPAARFGHPKHLHRDCRSRRLRHRIQVCRAGEGPWAGSHLRLLPEVCRGRSASTPWRTFRGSFRRPAR